MWCRSSSTATWATARKWCWHGKRCKNWVKLRCSWSKYTGSIATKKIKKWRSEVSRNRLATTITCAAWARQVSILAHRRRRDQPQHSTLTYPLPSSSADISCEIPTANASRISNSGWLIDGNADLKTEMTEQGLSSRLNLKLQVVQRWNQWQTEKQVEKVPSRKKASSPPPPALISWKWKPDEFFKNVDRFMIFSFHTKKQNYWFMTKKLLRLKTKLMKKKKTLHVVYIFCV